VKTALVLLALMCASGCAIAHYEEGSPYATDKISSIVVGQTTRQEILDWFGAPTGLADTQMLEAYLADRELMPGPVVDLPFADVLVFRLTKGHGRGFTVVLFTWLEFNVKHDTLVVFFDEHDHVTSYGYRKGTDDLPY